MLSLGRRLQKLLGVILIALVACAPSASVPAVTPQGELRLEEEEAGAEDAGPFRVVFAAPQGEAPAESELSIVFSRPLRELALAGDEATPPISMQPAIAGRWQWIGTRALLFVPDSGRLPAATKLVVEVPATTRAFDGSALGSPYRFELATPRPKLVRSTPYAGEEGRVPDTTIELLFNQPIAPDKLAASAKLTALGGKQSERIAFRVERPDAAAPRRLVVKPTNKLPVHRTISLEIAAGLVGEEGSLATDKPHNLVFSTYGPLAVERVECDRDSPHGRCRPGSPLMLELSNAVKAKDLKRHVSVTPAIALRWPSWFEDDDVTTHAEVVAAFEAGRTYTLQIAPGLIDRFGQRLAKPFSQSVAFDDHFPKVEIGVDGDYFEPVPRRAIAIGSVNVKRYGLVVAPLGIDDVMKLEARANDADGFSLLKSLKRTVKREVRPAAPRNKLARETVDPFSLLAQGGGSGRGPVAIGIENDEEREPDRHKRVRIVQVTDLALSAKLSRHGSLVWVTRLSNAEPVAGARVELRGGRGGPGATKSWVTDARGIATIAASEFAPDFHAESGDRKALLFASADGDITYRRVDRHLDSWRLGVETDLSGELRSRGMLFTDRGIYRPGDVIRLKGILRDETPTGSATPKAKRIQISLRAPDDEVVAKKTVVGNEFGTFSAEIAVPRSAALGGWQIATDAGGLSEWIQVGEYKPAEFEVTVESDKREYQRGDGARFAVSADYLFGAPMAKARVQYRVTYMRTWFSPPGTDAFATDATAYYADREEDELRAGILTSGDAVLDDKGSFSLSHKLELPLQRGAAMVSLDAEVTDVSRQSIGAGTSAVVHPAELYVGLSLGDSFFVQAPGRVQPRVIAVSPKGERIAGQRVRLELVSRRFTFARQDAGGGALHSVSRMVDKKLGACEVTTGKAPQACSLDVPQGGYYVVVASARDRRGNTAEAASSLYALGEGVALWGDRDDRSIELVADKKQYRVGDKARVLVKSPFPQAEALVTVERAGVRHVQRSTLRGATPVVEVPITEELRPNAFVSVHLVRKRTAPAPAAAGKPDAGAPAYRIGYAELAIDPSARRLAVAVKPSKKDLLPGETLALDLSVRDAGGRPQRAELAVYAVDEGVLSLTGYQTPDPLPVFAAPRPLQVATLETRDALARVRLADLANLLGVDKGAQGGGGGGPAPRRDFRQTAFFEPHVVTDGDGKARLSFKMPESLTTFRVMAVAVGQGDRYGFAAERVTTSRRLMARPALPRFLRAGDKARAGIVLSAKGFGPATVMVRAKAEGLAIDPPEQQIALGKNESKEVRFGLSATSATKAKLVFEVSAGAEKDSVEVEREVEPPSALEAVALYGKTADQIGERLGSLAKARRDVGSLEVGLSSTALVGLEAGVDQLLGYPYGCTEQIASRLMPLLPLRDLAKDFGIGLPKNAPSVIEKTVGDLRSRQRGDGGFATWPDTPGSHPWVSAYATWTLHQAKLRGAHVPAHVFERAKAYLRRFLEQLSGDRVAMSTAAFVVDVLAEIGAPDAGYAARLFEERAQLPAFARALLLHAMVVGKAPEAQRNVLLSELENAIRVDADRARVVENLGDEYAVLMDSDTRSAALVLRALMAAAPKHALGDELARGLLGDRRGGAWRSTQEAAYALLALDAYRRRQERDAPSFVARAWMAGREILSERFNDRSTRERKHAIPLSKLGAGGDVLAFDKDGPGTLFYQVRLVYAPRELPKQPLDRGFTVQKTLRTIHVAELDKAITTLPARSSTSFAAGDLVLADLIVVTPSPRDFVVVDDPLPAGFEAVDAALATTAAWLRVPASGRERDAVYGPGHDEAGDDAIAERRAFLASAFQREVRDRRVLFFVDHMAAGMYHYRYLARATTPGTFIVPPTRAEQMYVPEVFGRTASSGVEVR